MNGNRGFARFLAVLILVCAIGAAFATEYAAISDPDVRSEHASQVIDRSKKTDSLRAPELKKIVVPVPSRRIEAPVPPEPGRIAIA
jgi:hypothetical protein